MNGEAEENIFFSNFSEKLYFDLISCQFSLHYMFYSKESVQNLFRNLTYKLVNQGYVIMTIPDANVIVKRFRKNGKQFGVGGDFVVGNKFYSMKIDTLDFPKDKVYGLKYFFYLEDAVGDKKQLSDDDPIITYVPEYLIEFQNFVKTAENFGLELIEQKNFLDFYKDNRDEHKNLFSVLKLKYEENKSMNKNLWEISHLYKTVVFKKIRGKSMDEIERSFKDIKQSYYEIKMEEKFR